MVTIESWFGSFVVKSFVSRLWSLSLSTSQPCYKINCAKHNEKWSLVNIFLAKINVGRHFLSGVEFYTEMMQGVYRFWSISYGLWIFIYVFCSKLVFWRKLILRTFKVQLYIQTIVNLKTIVDHCPQNFENHRKTIGSNGWTPQKTFNGDGPTLSKPLKNHWRQWWPKKKTLTIPSPWKIDHRCGLYSSIQYIYSFCTFLLLFLIWSSSRVSPTTTW